MHKYQDLTGTGVFHFKKYCCRIGDIGPPLQLAQPQVSRSAQLWINATIITNLVFFPVSDIAAAQQVLFDTLQYESFNFFL